MVKLTNSPARLEAFSDGVIAVIITIMVLELKVPHPDGIAGLREVLPNIGIYALSFAFTGIYWINHHHLVSRTKEVDHAILYANLAFLFCLSLLPFFTSYLIDKKLAPFAVALYGISLVVIAFSFMLLRLAIRWRLRHEGTLEEEDQAAVVKHWSSMGLYFIAIPLAFYHPYIAIGLCALVTLVWIYPTAHVHPHSGTRHPD